MLNFAVQQSESTPCCCSVAQLCLTPCNIMDRLPCPPLFPGVCWNSFALNQWCHPTTSSSVLLLLVPSTFLSIRVFSNESALHIRWPEFWSFSFSISPSNEYSGLTSFRIDWFEPLVSKRHSRVFSDTTVQKHQSAVCIHISSPSWASFPPTHPHPTHLGHHRELSWAPYAIQ